MSDELREAAEKYAQCRHLQNRESIEAQRAFQKGAGWATRNLRWILAKDQLPDKEGKYFILTKREEIRTRTFFLAYDDIPAEFASFEEVIAWCPIPEQLLNFKLPAEEAGKDED